MLGGTTTLTAPSVGGGPASYQWQFGGANIPGATNASLLITSFRSTNAGFYQVIVSNALRSVSSPPMILTAVSALRFDSSFGVQYSNSQYHLRLLGPSGLGPVVVYTSSNLFNWEPIFTNPPQATPLEFTDPVLPGRTQRFYRATEVEPP
jgi:hypothetical protein